MVQDKVTTLGAIAGDVAESPDRLLLHVLEAGAEEFDEDGESARLDDAAGLHRVAAGDVGEGPGGLELQLVVVALQELDELGHDAGADDLVDGRVGLLGEELAEALRHLELLLVGAVQQELDHLGGDQLLNGSGFKLLMNGTNAREGLFFFSGPIRVDA